MSILKKKTVVNPVEETVEETIENAVAEVTEEQKPRFTFRELVADDIFTLSSIISKIGIREFKNCFDQDTMKNLASTFTTDEEGKKELSGEDAIVAMGISIAPALLSAADVILCNLSKCKDDIYKLLADVSLVKVDDIRALSMSDFAEMVIAFVKKEDFKDFFKVVSKSFK